MFCSTMYDPAERGQPREGKEPDRGPFLEQALPCQGVVSQTELARVIGSGQHCCRPAFGAKQKSAKNSDCATGQNQPLNDVIPNDGFDASHECIENREARDAHDHPLNVPTGNHLQGNCRQ